MSKRELSINASTGMPWPPLNGTAMTFSDGSRFDTNKLTPAYITAIHNGVLILNHFELKGDTPYHRPPLNAIHPPDLFLFRPWQPCWIPKYLGSTLQIR